jgi:hypothetical protein
MSATLLDIKKFVASQTGKTDWSVADSKRDTIINQARREFYSLRKWKFLKKTATLTFSSGEADFPTDYNPNFDVGEVYSYSGTDKTVYTQVELEDLTKYTEDSASQYVFAIDYENSVIKSNQQSTTPSLTYFHLPADRATDASEDTEAEPTTDITCINLLATAMWWLAKERDEDNYNRFYVRYQEALKKTIQRDNINGPAMSLPNYLSGFDQGWNR